MAFFFRLNHVIAREPFHKWQKLATSVVVNHFRTAIETPEGAQLLIDILTATAGNQHIEGCRELLAALVDQVCSDFSRYSTLETGARLAERALQTHMGFKNKEKLIGELTLHVVSLSQAGHCLGLIMSGFDSAELEDKYALCLRLMNTTQQSVLPEEAYVDVLLFHAHASRVIGHLLRRIHAELSDMFPYRFDHLLEWRQFTEWRNRLLDKIAFHRLTLELTESGRFLLDSAHFSMRSFEGDTLIPFCEEGREAYVREVGPILEERDKEEQRTEEEEEEDGSPMDECAAMEYGDMEDSSEVEHSPYFFDPVTESWQHISPTRSCP